MTSSRDRFITATNELFRRSGYHGTPLTRIIDAAGAPNGSLYHHFPGGKSELAAAVVRDTGATYRELFESIADEAGDIGAAIEAFFDGAADILETTDFIDVCPIGTLARELASSDERVRLATDAVFASWIDSLAARLVGAGCEPSDAAPIATTVLATLEGGFVLARARRDADVIRRAGSHCRRLVEAVGLSGDGDGSRRPRTTRHR